MGRSGGDATYQPALRFRRSRKCEGNCMYSRPLLALSSSALALAGCTGLDLGPITPAPSYKFTHQHYDAASENLLTGGLGASGLAKAQPPTAEDPKNPTAAELRTRA